MQRREFITLVGGATAAWPLAARAQQPSVPVVGYLNARASADGAAKRYLAAFLRGLSEAGFIEGQSVKIEYRWAEGQYDRLPALAADLVSRSVTMIAATGGDFSVRAAKGATAAIPIVFTTAGDPVQTGLVTSLNRPGGNVTGVTSLGIELGAKVLEVMHEMVPAAGTIALLLNPNNANGVVLSNETAAAARALGLTLHVLRASTRDEIDTIFASLAQLRVGALVIASDAFFTAQASQIAAWTLRGAVPALSTERLFPEAGGLMSYGGDFSEVYRQAGLYAGRILKGDKPANLPVVQATKIELVINLTTAKVLGLTVPQSILLRADEVIE